MISVPHNTKAIITDIYVKNWNYYPVDVLSKSASKNIHMSSGIMID